ncbi:uncharacterized protein LOC135686382 [Rhopilema esculentum]|uniref:uncharacterized protein LOC135686382 n=1 Tax=Rhopilema esculentum TaxID=499914 RepID=UPI0031D3EC7F|eukprot:gene680-10387_t
MSATNAKTNVNYSTQNGHNTTEENEEESQREKLTKMWVESQIRGKQLMTSGTLPKREAFENRRLRNFHNPSAKADGNGNQGEDRYNLQEEQRSQSHKEQCYEIDIQKGELDTDLDNDIFTDLSGMTLHQKIEALQLSRDGLHLPLISKSPFTSPVGSPALFPRNSFMNGADTSPASSSGNSPQISPRMKLNSSLPRNFRDQFSRETRSLPGSPVFRRGKAMQPADPLDKTTAQNNDSFRGDQQDPELILSSSHRDVSPQGRTGLASRESLTANKLSFSNARTNLRRPGTPVARDLRPSLGLGQFSRSLSDLNSIREADSETKVKRSRPLLLPSIGN